MKQFKATILFVAFCALFPAAWSQQPGSEITYNCITCSTTPDCNAKYPRGQKNATCVFPFTVGKTTYHKCTYDHSHVTYYQPWCSTKTDELGRHVSGGGNWGICDDKLNCPIPPRDCGVPVRTRPNRNDVDTDVNIEQQPWMVSLGKYVNFDSWEHQCGGSLFTARHVLTAAHCFNHFDRDREGNYKLGGYVMRFGTADPSDLYSGDERSVIAVHVHPKFKQDTPSDTYYDVGIAVARIHIEFNEFVRPICMPYLPVDDEDDLANEFVTLAGWGLTLATNNSLVFSKKLKLISLQVNPTRICERIFSLENVLRLGIPDFKLRQQLPSGFQKNIACVGNDFAYDQGACEGDSGSPVIRRVSDTAKSTPYYEQQFVVSTGIDNACKFRATIYVRITERQVLSWIQKITRTTPLLMVFGGYNASVTPKLVNDVELISTTSANNRCSKHVRPLKVFRQHELLGGTDIDPRLLLLSENGTRTRVVTSIHQGSIGSVGAFVKDTAIICGGKSEVDNLADCYEFDNTQNKWHIIQSMAHKRTYASSVLDERGNFWVLGGTHNSRGSLSTEVYQYGEKPRTGRWRRGHPLPEDLRDTGISSHCSVRLNKTHVMIAGGYAAGFNFSDPFAEELRQQSSPSPVTGSAAAAANDSDLVSLVDVRSSFGQEFNQSYTNVSITYGLPDQNNLNDSRPDYTTENNVKAQGGGRTLRRAWMYDGLYWDRVADMSQIRDRPACSLVEDPNTGKIRVLVAGGCDGWCVVSPATKTAEVFDPETGVWTRVADMPKPLMSAKMEILDGLPTVVGGYDNVQQNDVLYQYHPATDEWLPHPYARLRIARSSATVFQVPRGIFRHCTD